MLFLLKVLISPADNDGTAHPSNIPSAIAINIHNVRYLSKNDNLDDLLLKITPPILT